MMDREGSVLNCQTAVTTNDSRLAVHCSILCLICKPNPSYTKIWGHVSMGLTRTKYRSYYISLGNRAIKGAEGTTAMLHVFETESLNNKLQASTACTHSIARWSERPGRVGSSLQFSDVFLNPSTQLRKQYHHHLFLSHIYSSLFTNYSNARQRALNY
jgi:hypothetical protein